MKKRYGLILLIIIIALLVYTLKDIDFYEVSTHLQKVNPIFIVLAFLFTLFMFLFWTLRWRVVMRDIEGISFLFLLQVLFATVFLNTITPGTGVGGEPAAAFFLKKKYKKSKTKFLGYIVASKVLNYVIFVLFIIFSILFLFFFLEVSAISKIITQSLILLFTLLAVIVFVVWKGKSFNVHWISKKIYVLKSVKKHFNNLSIFEKYVKERKNNFLKVFKEVITNKRKLYYGLLISLGFWVLNFLASYILFLAFDAKIGFLNVVIVVTISYLVGDLSPVPGGIGMMEGSMILLYTGMGIPPALATIVALLSRMIYYFFALFIGGISLLYLKWKLK